MLDRKRVVLGSLLFAEIGRAGSEAIDISQFTPFDGGELIITGCEHKINVRALSHCMHLSALRLGIGVALICSNFKVFESFHFVYWDTNAFIKAIGSSKSCVTVTAISSAYEVSHCISIALIHSESFFVKVCNGGLSDGVALISGEFGVSERLLRVNLSADTVCEVMTQFQLSLFMPTIGGKFVKCKSMLAVFFTFGALIVVLGKLKLRLAIAAVGF
mmetsp:Transcript_30635/g.52499  ORF Transcript_30635/g.52499 Transcript_30635/m.52499 type:complete len:217 (-) Transcript_30635:41-691(-)